MELARDKYEKTREAQKLAEVKVMELEQRLQVAIKEAKDAADEKGFFFI